MTNDQQKLRTAFEAWKEAEADYVAASDALRSGSIAYDRDAIQSKIDIMIKLKNDFDLLTLCVQ